MPQYEYACSECGEQFTLRRKIAEIDEPAECPICESMETERRISIFYATNTGSSTAAASSPSTKVRHF